MFLFCRSHPVAKATRFDDPLQIRVLSDSHPLVDTTCAPSRPWHKLAQHVMCNSCRIFIAKYCNTFVLEGDTTGGARPLTVAVFPFHGSLSLNYFNWYAAFCQHALRSSCNAVPRQLMFPLFDLTVHGPSQARNLVKIRLLGTACTCATSSTPPCALEKTRL